MELYPGYLEDHFNIHKLSFSIGGGSAASPPAAPDYDGMASAQFAAPVGMGAYERPAPIGAWSHEPFDVVDDLDSTSVGGQATSVSTVMEADHNSRFHARLEYVPRAALEPARSTDQETSKPPDKVHRRLAQNREAAKRSRLRKKAYIKQLETSRVKLSQLEQELQLARRQQGVCANGNQLGDSTLRFAGTIDAGVAAFEIEYSHWVEEQNRHTAELRNALQGQQGQQQQASSGLELRVLVETGLNNYEHLFRIKSVAAHSDVFYIMSGVWRTPAERFFLWIGGFRPSEILKILRPQLETMTEPQRVAVCGLQQTSTQAEDALFQGMQKLQQNLTEALTVVDDPFASSEAYVQQMVVAAGKLKELVGFVTQADHLRQTTLQQLRRILTTRQVARALLALGDYFHRLRALSQLWAARPRESAIS